MENNYDIIVIGGGPAGLTAGLYALRNGKKTLIIEKCTFGGQITNSPKVENIPGFETISGDEFADKFLDQVVAQGGEVIFDEATKVSSDDTGITVTLASGAEVRGKACVLATGTKHRTLGLPGEEELIGAGVHFCAVCDGDFYEGKKVVIIGGGNSAFVEANLLVEIASKLVVLQDMPFFTADKKLQDQLFSHKNLETHVGTKILDFITDSGKLTGVKYVEDGVEKVVDCDGVFLAIGLIPSNDAFTNVADLDERGYFDSDESTKTKTTNVFVAGDCRKKTLRQVTTAFADGAMAAIAACDYINSI